MKKISQGADSLKDGIIAALDLMTRWQLKLIYWIIREILMR